MKPSKMKEIHENEWNPRRRSSYDDPRMSFFEARKDMTIHRVYKIDDSTWYLVFSTERTKAGVGHYRVARFKDNGKISILGYGTTATKFVKTNGIPSPDEIEKSAEIKRDNGHTPWLIGSKVYG